MKLKTGKIQVYTGNGKGKTTAALGLALRASAAGLRVYMGQFCKGQLCSEHKTCLKKSGLFTIKQFGEKSFIRTVGPVHKKHAQKALKTMAGIVASGKYDVVIFDEICVAINLGLVQEDQVLDCIVKRPPHVEIICTGRNAPSKLLQAADLVTQMQEIKHYFTLQGLTARKGIEY